MTGRVGAELRGGPSPPMPEGTREGLSSDGWEAAGWMDESRRGWGRR